MTKRTGKGKRKREPRWQRVETICKRWQKRSGRTTERTR